MKSIKSQTILLLFTSLVVMGIMTFLSNIRTVFYFILSFVVFVIPGILYCKLLCEPRSRLEIFFIGSSVGLGISCFVSAIAGFVFGSSHFVFFVALVFISFLLIVAERTGFSLNNIKSIAEKNDYSMVLFCSIILVSALLIIPYASFGKLTDSGLFFKDLHSTDLLHHMSVVVWLPKGIPPLNPYFSDGLWNYYWGSHIFPSIIYSLFSSEVSSRDIMMLTSLAYSLLFVGTLFYLIISYYNDKKILALLMVLSLIAYGYNDLYVLLKYLIKIFPESVASLNLGYFIIDEQGQEYTGYSHGWFRNFLVEPHSTLALTIFMSIIILFKKNELKANHYFMYFSIGMLLGILFSIDAFIGMIATTWFLSSLLLRMIQEKVERRNMIINSIIFLTVLSGIMILIFLLGILKPGQGYLVIKPYLKMIVLSPFYFLIDYGLQFVLALYGFLYVYRTRSIKDYQDFILMATLCLFFMFFTNYSDIGSTQMIRKGGMILRIPLVIFAGIALIYFFENNRNKKNMTILGLSFLLAMPTPVIDIYKLYNSKSEGEISHIKAEDIQAYQWIKQNLSSDSVIQDFPSAITPLLAFAERRVSLADWEHARGPGGAGKNKVAERHKKIQELFKTHDINLAVNLMKELDINYIYINPGTLQRFPVGSKKFESDKNIFKKIYFENEISIYEFLL